MGGGVGRFWGVFGRGIEEDFGDFKVGLGGVLRRLWWGCLE